MFCWAWLFERHLSVSIFSLSSLALLLSSLQRLSFIFIIIDFSLLTHFCFPLIQPAEEEPSPTLSTFSIQPSRKKKSSPNFSSLQFNPAERRTKRHRLSHSFDSTQKKKNLDSIDSGEIDIPKNKRRIISSFFIVFSFC